MNEYMVDDMNDEEEGKLRLWFLKDQKYGIIMGLTIGLIVGVLLGVLICSIARVF